MATKKTDILEDFKQRSGQKRQYEEESVSSAGSSPFWPERYFGRF